MTALEDFLLEQYEPVVEEWTIDDDSAAEWALRKMRRALEELNRVEAQATEQRRLIDQWVDQAKAGPRSSADFFESKLIDYYRQLEANDPDLAKTYKLPAGTIQRRRRPASTEVVDEAAFVEWAYEHAPEALTIRPRVSGLKSDRFVTAAHDDEPARIVTDDGEVVPGVQVVRGAVAYSAKPDGVA